jgi:hypothetical protein
VFGGSAECLTFSVARTVTRAALPSVIAANERVLCGVFVTSGAMRLAGVVDSRLPAPDIFGRRHGFEMIGVHTWSMPTKMIQVKAVRDCTADGLVGNPMRQAHLALVPVLPVPLAVTGSDPR